MPTAAEGRARTPAASRRRLRQRGYGRTPEPPAVARAISRVPRVPIRQPVAHPLSRAVTKLGSMIDRANTLAASPPSNLRGSTNIAGITSPTPEAENYAAELEALARKIKAQTDRVERKAAKQQLSGKTLQPTGPQGRPQALRIGPDLSVLGQRDQATRTKQKQARGAKHRRAVHAGRATADQLLQQAKEARHPDTSTVNALLDASVGLPVGSEAAVGTKLLSLATRGGRAAVGETASRIGGRVAAGIAERTPEAVKVAARGTADVASKGWRSAPVRVARTTTRVATTPTRVPLRYAGEHPGKSALAVNLGPGTFAAGKSGNPADVLAPVEAYWNAITQHPGKVAGTSARAIEGMLAAPIGIATNVGISGGRAVSEVAHEAGIPGAAGYSGKEILAPAQQQAKDVADFGIEMAKTFASGDPARIQKAIEENYGLTPLAIAGIPGTKLLRRAGVPDAVGAKLRQVPAVRRLMELKDNRTKRFETAKHAEREQRKAQAEAFGRTGKNEVPGLASIIEALRNSENRGRKAGKVSDEHLVKTLAETGMTDRFGMGETQIRRYAKVFGARHPEAKAEHIVPADVAHQLLSDPSRLSDAALTKAVDDFRTLQRDTGIETSPRAKYLKQALLVGARLPEDRFLEAAKNLGVSDALAGKVDNILAEALHEADTTGKDFGRILDERAKADNVGRELLTRVERKATEEFVAETRKKADALGLQEPAWTHDSNVLAREGNAFPAAVRGHQGRTSHNLSHRTYGVLQEKGLADQSFEALAGGSVIHPRIARAVNRSTQSFLEQEAKPKPVGKDGAEVRILTARQADKAYRDGLIDPKSEMLLSSQNTKSAILDEHARLSQPRVKGQPKEEPAPVLNQLEADAKKTLADEMARVYAMKKEGVPGTKGPTFIVVDRAKGDEFVRQHQIRATVPAKLQRVASRAILGYSPAWLLAQPVAEGAQGWAAVGVTHQVRGLQEYKKLSAREKQEFDTIYGTTPGTSEIPTSIVEAEKNISKVGKALQSTATGRLAYDILTGHGASKIDRAKALAIRRAVAAGHLSREYDKFTHGLGNLMGEAENLRGLSKEQVMRHFATHPEARAKLESYVDDVMGNWTVLTARERKLAAAVIFYPYLRMSLQWTFHTFPARHPYKAAIQHFLAQENANKVAELTKGDPSLFQQWASAPLYTGEGGKPEQLLPLWRVVPGANTLSEGIGGGENPALSALQATNPALSIGVTSFAGIDPLSGRRIDPSSDSLPSIDMMGRYAAAQGLNLFAPYRFGEAMLDRGGVTRAIQGKDYSKLAQLFAKAVESQGTRGVRSFTFPFLPQNADKQALAAYISRLADASNWPELQKIESRYGIQSTPPSSSGSSSSGGWRGSSSSSSSGGWR